MARWDLLNIAADKAPQSASGLPFDTARAHALYMALFGEVRDLIAGKHLLLVPSGPLTQLPFQVLVTQAPGTAPYRSTAWLARSYALTVLPAVSSLKSLRRVAKPSAATKPMIGFGNPLLDGDQGHPQFGAFFKQQAALARAHMGCAQAGKQPTGILRGARLSLAPLSQKSGRVDVAEVRLQTPLPEIRGTCCEQERIFVRQ